MLLLCLGDKVIKKILKGLLVIVCMVTIFYFSSDNGDESTYKSDSVILRVSSFFGVEDLSKKEQQSLIDTFVVPVRKSAHFFVYFVLGITLVSFLREFSIPILKLLLISIFLAFLYACSDEVHQLFVIGRTGRVLDVIIDTLGASTGVFFYYFLFRKKIKEVSYEQKERTC